MTQGNLFGPFDPNDPTRRFDVGAGKLAKELGMELAARRHLPLLTRARWIAEHVARNRKTREGDLFPGEACADDVYKVFVLTDVDFSDFSKAAGHIFDDDPMTWKWTGRYHISTRVSNHGHDHQKIWRLK